MYHGRIWAPITDFPTHPEALNDPALAPLVQSWVERQGELQSRDSYRTFIEKLRRQWAIETGILERLYTLSDSATKTLIEHGLDAALIGQEDTDRSPAMVLSLIRDQHHAIEGLYQFVSQQRSLSASYIRELHQVITASQDYCDVINTLGHETQTQLIRGAWKRLPNHITFDDGSRFEYCPPEHVDSEVESLVRLHLKHVENGVSPEVEAAWLHHRFSLIHPFQDGNGRVARCLATLIVLRAGWLPLVVTRHDRPSYIEALRSADKGELRPLVMLFAELERKSIRQALDLSDDVHRVSLTLSQALSTAESLVVSLGRKLDDEYMQVLPTADALHLVTTNRLKEVARELDVRVKKGHQTFTAFADAADRTDSRASFHRYQIGQAATALGYYANLNTYASWSRIGIQMSNTRTEVLVSFHGSGRIPKGIIACCVMIYERVFAEEAGSSPSDATQNTSQIADVEPIGKEPFEFSFRDELPNVSQRYESWLEERLLEALRKWNPRI